MTSIFIRHVDVFNRRSHLHEILLHAEVLDDELLPLGGVFANEEGEQFVAAVEAVEVDRVEPDGFADEVLELAGGDFAVSGDFHAFRDLPEPEERFNQLAFAARSFRENA